MVVFGFLGMTMWNDHEKSVAIDRIVVAAKLCGKGSTMTPAFARFEIDEMRSGGADERSAERMVMFEACGYMPND